MRFEDSNFEVYRSIKYCISFFVIYISEANTIMHLSLFCISLFIHSAKDKKEMRKMSESMRGHLILRFSCGCMSWSVHYGNRRCISRKVIQQDERIQMNSDEQKNQKLNKNENVRCKSLIKKVN